MIRASATVSALDELLKPLGFRHRKYVWNRRNGDFVDVVELEVSKSGIDFTINVGVAHAQVLDIVWGTGNKSFIHQPECMIDTRAPRLVFGREKWWNMTDPSAADEIVELIRGPGLAFFDPLHSAEALKNALVDGGALQTPYIVPRLYVAALLYLLGQQREGCDLIFEIDRSPPPPVVWRVARRLGCERSEENGVQKPALDKS